MSIGFVFQLDPLIDATLFKVDDEDLLRQIDLKLRRPYKNSVICGIYTGHIEDLEGCNGASCSSEYPMVTKCSSACGETKGILGMDEFEDPSRGIAGGLLIIPDGTASFSGPGDSGSVIYQLAPHEHTKIRSEHSHHESVAMLTHGVQGIYPDITCSLGFRLSDAVKHFEKVLTKMLTPLLYDHPK